MKIAIGTVLVAVVAWVLVPKLIMLASVGFTGLCAYGVYRLRYAK